ncbi:hypothetical protein Ddye_006642 [Dipteronia dyeriana]|uniref:Uncharacterized protein n=1 Tax=Dipteronia dyeriana TaxID=168575 RepID=A0AAD9XIJ5_9ROSI|nr:hypothetical protein Ddye_006642 [Dipteronia dyeriana]
MRSSKHNQNKFVRFITIPIRVLSKARDMYVKSLTDYAKGARYRNTTPGQFAALPKSFSVGPVRSNTDNEDYKELVRAASVRSMGHTNEAEMLLQQHMGRPPPQATATATAVVGSKGFPKSCSVGMGFMGRIDEEKPGDVGEDSVGSVNSNKAESYSRSRTVSLVTRTNAFNQ